MTVNELLLRLRAEKAAGRGESEVKIEKYDGDEHVRIFRVFVCDHPYHDDANKVLIVGKSTLA